MLTAQLSLIAFTASVLTSGAIQQTPQTPPQTATPATQKSDPPKIDAADLPVDLDRIQRALANTPRLQFDRELKPVFRVQVFGEKPTIEEILGPDFGRGPVPHGAMTHQEFLDLVTPTDAQGYAAFTNTEGATIAATSFLLQWTLQRAIQKYNETHDEQARAAARQEVLDALDALEKARARAGAGR